MSEVTPTVSYRPAKSGYTAAGQEQPGSGDSALALASTGINKGGMRGIGLAIIAVAEAILKKKATDLARDYYRTNVKDYNNFRASHEGALRETAQEAMSPYDNPTYKHDFYASAPAGMAKTAILDKQWYEARRRTHRYATGLQSRLDYDFAVQRMHGIVAGWNLGRRYEIAYADEHNNRQFDRKIEAANIGVGIGNVVRQGLSSSIQNVAAAYDNIGDTVSTIGNGLAQRSGYEAGRARASGEFGKRTNTKEFRKE